MSYNNYLDAEAAFSMASDFKDPCCVIVKHTNSCGVSVVKEGERDLLEAYRVRGAGGSDFRLWGYRGVQHDD